jgi:aldose 1-epimerase
VEVITDQPGLQVYSGNFFNGSENGKNGKPLTYRSSLVLEAQAWPDAINHPNFPSIEIAPSQTYHSNTIFRFGAE